MRRNLRCQIHVAARAYGCLLPKCVCEESEAPFRRQPMLARALLTFWKRARAISPEDCPRKKQLRQMLQVMPCMFCCSCIELLEQPSSD